MIPVDGAQLVKDWLKNRAAADHPTLRVVLEVPDGWKLGAAPVLVVADDSGPRNLWPVATSPQIRVTSWTSGRDRTYAHWAMAQLLGQVIPGVACVLPGTGVLDARDTKTRADLASFTVRTRMRTTP